MGLNPAERYLSGLAKSGVRPSLERIRSALEAFGRPDRACRLALVTGTNGKGTCAKALAEILRAHGLRTGLYLSPHLLAYPERYEIAGRRLTARTFETEVFRQRRLLADRRITLTEFEFLTLLAYRLFAAAQVDFAVAEVGMGGRWDATNAADPCLSILTSVGIDHVEFLGKTDLAIAADKACIARPGRPLLVGPVRPPVRAVIEKVVRRIGGRPIFLSARPIGGRAWRAPLPEYIFGSDYDLAVRAAREILDRSFQSTAAQSGIRRAILPGRFQEKRFRNRRILLDVAHNGQALEALFAVLQRRFRPRRIQILLGMQRQKRGEEKILPYLRATDRVRLVQLATDRSKPISLWKPFIARARGRQVSVDPPSSMRAVFSDALKTSSPADLMVVTGSFYTVREAMRLCG